ncbi:hypothetical protein [Bradyrhizobium embrapense]
MRIAWQPLEEYFSTSVPAGVRPEPFSATGSPGARRIQREAVAADFGHLRLDHALHRDRRHAASMALPQPVNISTAASVACRCEVAAMPRSATATERPMAMKSRVSDPLMLRAGAARQHCRIRHRSLANCRLAARQSAIHPTVDRLNTDGFGFSVVVPGRASARTPE